MVVVQAADRSVEGDDPQTSRPINFTQILYPDGSHDRDEVRTAQVGSMGYKGFQITLNTLELGWGETVEIRVRIHANPSGYLEAEWVEESDSGN